MNPAKFPSFLAIALLCPSLYAADLFSEGFDGAGTAKIGFNNGAGASTTYVDYANMTVGTTLHSIPEAPRQIPGSLNQRGLLLKVDYALAATDRIANVLALDDVGGTRIQFSNNYRLKFDCYLRLSPGVTLNASGLPTNTGTTEHMLWGVGYLGVDGAPVGRGWRSSRGTGTWGWLSTEGGHGATVGSDASLYVGGSLIGGRNMDLVAAVADTNTYFAPAFGATASPVPNCPANQWVQADITVLGGQVTVQYQAAGRTAVKFFENVSGNVAGAAMVGYEDAFTSTSFAPDEQWMLLDNMVVEDLTPPTMTVAAATALTTYTGQATAFTYTISNVRTDAPLTISAVNFSGTNAQDFSVSTALPLVIPAGQSASLELRFNPVTGPNGLRTAAMTIISDDPQSPSFLVSGLSARRSAGGFLMARYSMDEASGNFADSSGNGFTGAVIVRDPVVYSQPSLLGVGSAGSAAGFAPAQSSVTGNYFTTAVTHTPSFSVSMWIKPTDAGATRTLFQRDPDFDSSYEEICGLLLSSTGQISYKVNSTEVLNSSAFIETILSGNTYHVVLTHLDTDGFGNTTAQRSRLYINGKMMAEAVDAATQGFGDYPSAPLASAMHIGTRTVAGSGYAGDMDDIQIYGSELTREQVWEIYTNAGTVPAMDWNIVSASRTAVPAGFTVTFPSSPNGMYQLYRSSTLSGWQPVGEAIPGNQTGIYSTLTDPPRQGKILFTGCSATRPRPAAPRLRDCSFTPRVAHAPYWPLLLSAPRWRHQFRG